MDEDESGESRSGDDAAAEDQESIEEMDQDDLEADMELVTELTTRFPTNRVWTTYRP